MRVPRVSVSSGLQRSPPLRTYTFSDIVGGVRQRLARGPPARHSRTRGLNAGAPGPGAGGNAAAGPERPLESQWPHTWHTAQEDVMKIPQASRRRQIRAPRRIVRVGVITPRWQPVEASRATGRLSQGCSIGCSKRVPQCVAAPGAVLRDRRLDCGLRGPSGRGAAEKSMRQRTGKARDLDHGPSNCATTRLLDILPSHPRVLSVEPRRQATHAKAAALQRPPAQEPCRSSPEQGGRSPRARTA